MATIFDQVYTYMLIFKYHLEFTMSKFRDHTTRGVFGLGTNQCLCACVSPFQLPFSRWTWVSEWFLLAGDRKGIRPQKLCFNSSLFDTDGKFRSVPKAV